MIENFMGPFLYAKALAKSRNVPAVRVLKNIGILYAIDYAKKLGISSDLNKSLSLALGPSVVSPLELVTTYSVFANLGELIKPVFITKILDRDGNEIQGMKVQKKQVIDKNTAYIMTNLLESVVKEGTARKVQVLNRPVAGKTGTSSELRDAWFIGYTPDYITGIWVGFDKERPLGKKETGSRAASPIWIGFMEKALKNKPLQEFKIPEGVVFANSECFKEGTEPSLHIVAETEEAIRSEVIAHSSHTKPAHPRGKAKRYQPNVIVGVDQFFKSSM